jgi:predicted kinase
MPRLIAIGGYPGAGKSTVARRLSYEMGIPRLGSDMLGRTIRSAHPNVVEPHRIGFFVLFALAEEFLADRCPVIVDTNMGWEFHWQRLDEIVARQHATFVPIILRCPKDVYLQRIVDRHNGDPEVEASVEKMQRMPHFERLCEFIDRLDRPDIHNIEAGEGPDETYALVRETVSRSATRDFAGPD